MTLIPFAERLAVELTLLLTTYVCRGWDSNTQPSVCWANADTTLTTYVCRGWDSNAQPSVCWTNALTHCATAAVQACVYACGK